MPRNPSSKRKIIIEYIKRNPKATDRTIKRDTKLHYLRYFKSLGEAYKLAKVNPQRTLERKTKKQRRKIIIDYLKKHPKAGGHTIAKDTKINVCSAFKSIKDAYKLAGIYYPRKTKEKTEENKKLLIDLIKENPDITLREIISKSGINPYLYFKNLEKLWEKAKIPREYATKKRRREIREKIIKFIKENPLSTQREINKNCKTKVQDMFDKGIFEAYNKANIPYPFERLKLYGAAHKEIKKRARDFEEEIAIKLSGYGNVNRLIKTKRGVADIILERKGRKIVVEVKDYQNKEISISQVKQLNKYVEDLDCKIGLLICHKKPKKDRFKIGKNKLFILEKEEISKFFL